MAHGPTGAMPDFRATSDDERAGAGTLDGDGAVDGTREDTFVRGAVGLGPVGAAASGGGSDSRCSQTGCSDGLGERGATALGEGSCADHDGRGGDGEKSGELLKSDIVRDMRVADSVSNSPSCCRNESFGYWINQAFELWLL